MIALTLPRPTPLERSLCRRLSKNKIRAQWTTFPNKEVMVLVPPFADHHTIVLGRTAPPAENFFQTLLLVDTLRRAGTQQISVIIPYLGYSRHDRSFTPGGSCASLLLASLFKTAGATTLLTADLHSNALFSAAILPVQNISLLPFMAAHLRSIDSSAAMIVSPDRGGIERSHVFAKAYGDETRMLWCEKVREGDGRVTITKLHGDITGDRAILVDDMLDTGGTIEAAAQLLRERGVRHLSLCITHPLFTGDAASRIARLNFDHIITTNTVPIARSVRRLLPLVALDVTDIFFNHLHNASLSFSL